MAKIDITRIFTVVLMYLRYTIRGSTDWLVLRVTVQTVQNCVYSIQNLTKINKWL